MIYPHHVVVAIAASVFFSGCCKLPNGPQNRPVMRAPTTAEVEAAVDELEDESYQISEEEAATFAQRLEQAMLDGDRNFLNVAMDWNHVLDRATAGFDLPAGEMQAMRRGFTEGVNNSGGLFGAVSQTLGEEGTYRLLDVRRQDGNWRVLFRMLPAEGGLNYHDLLLHKNFRGDVRVADAYVFATGEDFSTTVRQLLLTLIAQQDDASGLPDKDQDMLEHMDEMQAMARAVRAGQPDEALRIYPTLPETLQANKTVLVARAMAASLAMDDDELKATIEKMESLYPGDACLDLMAIDHYIAAEDFDKAVAAVNRLDEAVGGDPMLDVMRGNIAMEGGNTQRAAELAEVAIAAEPDLMHAYWLAVNATLAVDDHQGTLEQLKRLDQAFELEWEQLSLLPEYARFGKSEEYRDWLLYLHNR